MSAILDLTTAPLLTKDDLGELLRVKHLADRAIYHGWIKPCARTAAGGSGSWLFTRAEADKLVSRIKDGEIPPALPLNRKEVPV